MKLLNILHNIMQQYLLLIFVGILKYAYNNIKVFPNFFNTWYKYYVYYIYIYVIRVLFSELLDNLVGTSIIQ